MVPPDPISNSEVKQLSADGSVGPPHVRVGHRQALKTKAPVDLDRGFFIYGGVLLEHGGKAALAATHMTNLPGANLNIVAKRRWPEG